MHLMNHDVVPTVEAHDAEIETVLSGNGREFCGRPHQHPYELFRQLGEIEHRTTREAAAVERHRQALPTHALVRALPRRGRRTWFETVEECRPCSATILMATSTRAAPGPLHERARRHRPSETAWRPLLPSHDSIVLPMVGAKPAPGLRRPKSS
jgi:hypothetical protein